MYATVLGPNPCVAFPPLEVEIVHSCMCVCVFVFLSRDFQGLVVSAFAVTESRAPRTCMMVCKLRSVSDAGHLRLQALALLSKRAAHEAIVCALEVCTNFWTLNRAHSVCVIARKHYIYKSAYVYKTNANLST